MNTKEKVTAYGKWYTKFYPNYDSESYFSGEAGWNACKKECLKILNQPLQNLDLSEDYCDSRHIEKIEKL